MQVIRIKPTKHVLGYVDHADHTDPTQEACVSRRDHTDHADPTQETCVSYLDRTAPTGKHELDHTGLF